MKKTVQLLLCLLLVISLAVPALASETGEAPTQAPETQPPAETVHQHNWSSVSVTTAPTCTEGGIRTYTCACGAASTEEIAASGHSYGDWSRGQSTHERTCSVCGNMEAGSHGMTEQVTTAATCQTTGLLTHSCGVCGYSYTEEIPVSSTHSYGEWVLDESSHARSCTVCGVKDSGSHAWADTVVTVKPTCKEEGATAQVCTVCGGVLVEVLPKKTTHTYDNECDPECNICGHTREAEHKFSKVWSKNFSGHWHACAVCGEKADIADHFPGPAATEEEDQICLTCGYLMTPKLNHTHKYAEEWSSDEAGHWIACGGCEDQKDYDYHEYDDLCDPDCNVCGFASPTAHQLDEAWSSDETGHWTVCVLCREVTAPEAHAPAQTEDENAAVLCQVCGWEITPARVHVHETVDAWEADDESHWKACACGEQLDKATHVWSEGTENEDGTMTYTCADCGERRTEGEPEQPEEKKAFPFALILGILGIIAIGVIIALVVIRKGNKKPAGKYHR